MSGEQDRANGVEFLAAGDVKQEPNAEPKDTRVTTRFMTKYERARILGTRALQIRSVPPPVPPLITPLICYVLARTRAQYFARRRHHLLLLPLQKAC